MRDLNQLKLVFWGSILFKALRGHPLLFKQINGRLESNYD